MKNLFILFFSLTFSLSIFSQEKLQEKAKKISDEMTTVLSLNEETSEKIYYIQLTRFIDAQKIRKHHKGGDKKQMKAELKKMQGKLWHNLKNLVGRDNMKAWSMHKKAIKKS
jgi:membrane-associated HD superfamily phosphohydrolase